MYESEKSATCHGASETKVLVAGMASYPPSLRSPAGTVSGPTPESRQRQRTRNDRTRNGPRPMHSDLPTSCFVYRLRTTLDVRAPSAHFLLHWTGVKGDMYV